MLSARDTTLRADKAYIDLMEAESTWAFKYVFTNTNPVDPRRDAMWADVPGVAPAAIPVFNRLLPENYRMKHRASQNRPRTELFGTAPYRGLGRGVLDHVDVSTQLQQGNWVPEKGSRILTEIELNRREFVTIPADLRELPFESRYGAMTRAAPAYMQPHQ